MWNLRFVTFLLVTFGLNLIKAQEEIALDIPQGSLKGLKVATNLNGKPYFSFKGVPYARPMTGSTRFMAPTPADSWTGQLDATKHRSTCVFFCMIRQQVVGDEDCLYLNVYTPTLDKEAKKSVMVFFHPGGFAGGSGDDDLFGPDFLIEQDVILVTMNFRLGAAGFLSTGDANAPGNAGLKDQVLALKWVKDNIQNFGGCPNKVTIFGQSSGGAAVQFHLMSPMSKGLYRSAISQSGSAVNPWAMTYNPKEMAFKLGEALGVKTSDTKELVDKLKEFTLQDIVTATSEVGKSVNHMNGKLNPFTPSVEADVGQEIFLPNDPWTLIKMDAVADVPYMAGILQDETALFAPMFLANAEAMNQHFDMFIPDDLNVTDAQKKEMSDKIKQFYFEGKDLTAESKAEFTKLSSDIMFTSGVALTTKIISTRIKSPVYEYLFSFYSPVGLMKNLFKSEEGVTHGDDMTYEFYSNAFKNKPAAGSDSEKMANILSRMWANFAKEGNPTATKDDLITIDWVPQGEDNNYLEINMPLKVDKAILKDRIALWAQVYNDVLGDMAKLFTS